MKNKLISKAISNPLKTLSLLNRRYFRLFRQSKDMMIKYEKTWIYGKLKRVPLNDVFSGIEKINIELINPYSGTFNMSPTLNELVAISSITRFINAEHAIEIGTYDGGTTLNIAANIKAGGKVITIDIPANFTDYKLKIAKINDNQSENVNIGRMYKGHPYSERITQVLQDSAEVDYSSFGHKFDLFFIDGCHDFEYVKRDSENAIKHTRSGGVIIWHDYGMVKDVSRYIDSLTNNMKLFAIEGTRLAIGIK